jgi:hypothetical protein
VQSMRRKCTAVLNAAGGNTRYYWLTFDFHPPFVQGHIIPFMLVTCLWNLFSLCLSCWILCSYKYLHMLSLLKINAVDSERMFLFLLSLQLFVKPTSQAVNFKHRFSNALQRRSPIGTKKKKQTLNIPLSMMKLFITLWMVYQYTQSLQGYRCPSQLSCQRGRK